jgi:phosphoribosylformimino-5-aminoimidazole carboxamide ribonucleotide (ProFAR) isomerase
LAPCRLRKNDATGKPWKAPADFPGDRTLVILGYEEEQQSAIDTWTTGMGLTQPTNTLAWIEMPVIDEPGMVMRWIIDTGMQRGIPDQEIRSHVWTVYTDRAKFQASCGIESMADIHVLVVARDGTILAGETGRHTEAAAARLRQVLRADCPPVAASRRLPIVPIASDVTAFRSR